MKSIRCSMHCLTALLGVCSIWASSAAQGQYFRDDFEDGSATDGSPVTWVTEVPPFPDGGMRVEDGSLVITPKPSEFFPQYWETDWEVAREFPADVIVRTQLRALHAGASYQGVYARDTHNVDARQGRSVAAFVTARGTVGLHRVSNSVGQSLMSVSLGPVNLLDIDIHLELHLSGPSAMVFAWPEGSAKPSTPTLWSRTGVGSIWNIPGRVGVFAGQEDDTPLVSGAFRFVEVAPLPEPTSLALVASVAACCCRRPARRNVRRWAGAASATLLITLTAMAHPSHAATIFNDDFEDGSATDGSPVTWTPLPTFDTGSFAVVDGDYVITQPSDGWPQVATADMSSLTTMSMRAQFREITNRGFVSLLARAATQVTVAGYQAGIEPGGLYIVRTDAPFNNKVLAEATTALNPRQEDVILQFDALGPELRLYAWRAGEPMPDLPALVARDDKFPIRTVGLLIDVPGRLTHSVAFRYVHVADAPIPEPATLGLVGLAAASGMTINSRRRLPLVR